MGRYFRKSLNVGGIKFNLSKSGVGVSTGVKGLRVGVSSNGKAYIAGGRNGFYFKENLGQSNITDTNTYQENKSSEKKIACFILFIFLGILFFAIGANTKNDDLSNLGIFIFLGTIFISLFLLFFKAGKEKSYSNKIEAYINKVEEALNENNFLQISNLIQSMKSDNLSSESIAFILNGCSVYKKYLSISLEDKEISEDEKKLLEEFSKYIESDFFTLINDEAIDYVISEILMDGIITNEERESLIKISKTIKLSEYKLNEINKLLDQYEKIEKIQSEELTPLKDSNDNNCYYINTVELTTRRKTKYGYEYSSTGEGKIIIYDQYIQILVNGDKKIKISDIIDIYLDDEDINIIVKNRKTPICIYSEEPALLVAIISKLMMK